MTAEQFGAAYSTGYDRTVGFLVTRGVPRQAALDIAQDGWLRGWQRRDQLRDAALLGTWINSIALNIHRHHLQSPEGLAHQVEMPRGLQGSQIDTNAIDAWLVLQHSSIKDFGLLTEYYVHGLTSGELAERYGGNANTVRIRIMRASRKLAKRVCGRCARQRS